MDLSNALVKRRVCIRTTTKNLKPVLRSSTRSPRLTVFSEALFEGFSMLMDTGRKCYLLAGFSQVYFLIYSFLLFKQVKFMDDPGIDGRIIL